MQYERGLVAGTYKLCQDLLKVQAGHQPVLVGGSFGISVDELSPPMPLNIASASGMLFPSAVVFVLLFYCQYMELMICRRLSTPRGLCSPPSLLKYQPNVTNISTLGASLPPLPVPREGSSALQQQKHFFLFIPDIH